VVDEITGGNGYGLNLQIRHQKKMSSLVGCCSPGLGHRDMRFFKTWQDTSDWQESCSKQKVGLETSQLTSSLAGFILRHNVPLSVSLSSGVASSDKGSCEQADLGKTRSHLREMLFGWKAKAG